ncbi:MAG: proline--tRNA ligase [Rhodospirillaceae bacterium]|nr:proline--tRNA ligase [Rhodospirillaceae bacterium]|tara:strand:+ start:116 stop:1435 length:1320 start_codon:yes stop_codon:yes gene_type:complete
MRLTNYFLPTLRETPAEAQINSHRLMLRAGLIRQASAGIYSWLPMGYRVLQKISEIVRAEQNRAGAHEMLMPTLQLAELWKRSGRYEAYGPEMLRIKDRNNRDMLYGPTNEEQITEIVSDSISSYKDLPKTLFHIQWKFRDEVRPRFGVMRGREFLMKDGYSFDLSPNLARTSYNKMFISYLRTFARMGLKAIPMRADSGPIGGSMSHEFIILAETGESKVFFHSDYLGFDVLKQEVDYTSDLSQDVALWTKLYAATDEQHNSILFDEQVPSENQREGRGIEVGHIFYFGKKYSDSMKAQVLDSNGDMVGLEMGSYGIGVSRLVGAIIEANHDENGIIWPTPVAPYRIGIINLKVGSKDCDEICEELYARLKELKIDVLYDDRDARAGAKFVNMDLIGLPFQVIVGPKSAKNKMVEVKIRATSERFESDLPGALSKVID